MVSEVLVAEALVAVVPEVAGSYSYKFKVQVTKFNKRAVLSEIRKNGPSV